VASSPSPQHLPSEGPVRLSHLVPKTSLDGGDAALRGTMPSSSSSAADTPPAGASSEETVSNVAAEELRTGDTVEFGVSRMSLVRVQDMQQLGYFGGGVARVSGAEEVPEPEGELVIFEAFFAAGLRLLAHRFVGEVLRRFDVQVHQLTPNAVVALAKYV
jgi:hypothetical protein